MLARAEVRTIALYAIDTALTGQGATTDTSTDVPAQAGEMPIVAVYTQDTKQQTGAGRTQFTTMIITTVEVRCEGATKAAAEAQCDLLCGLIENGLLAGDSLFFGYFEEIMKFDAFPDYEGENNANHIFTCTIEIHGRVAEFFEPTLGTQLSKVNVTVTAGPTGTPTIDVPITIPTE